MQFRFVYSSVKMDFVFRQSMQIFLALQKTQLQINQCELFGDPWELHVVIDISTLVYSICILDTCKLEYSTCLFVCFEFFVPLIFFFFFFWSLSSHSRIFHSYEDATIAGEGLKMLTYARHSWPLSSEGSLTYHTHCDTGPPFIMVVPLENFSLI